MSWKCEDVPEHPPRLLDSYQLQFKHQCFIRPDVRARTPRPIRKLWRNDNLPLGARGHECQCFTPAWNQLGQFQIRCFTRLGAAELGSVEGGAPVSNLHCAAILWFLS